MRALAIALPLAIAYLRDRWLATLLNVALMALGLATVVALMLVATQATERLERDAAGIDAVVGAKGSPLQLVLSAVFQVDVPTGNISAADADRIAALPAVKRAIPLALGDSVGGHRIVGTTPDYLALHGAVPAAGRVFADEMEAVLGSAAARATGLTPGAAFTGSHGLGGSGDGGAGHADHPFRVVGVLAPTGSVIDRLVLTSVESVREIHGHDSGATPEVTALLVQYRSPIAALSFPRAVNALPGVQAASPAAEMARLFGLLGLGASALTFFAGVMLAAAGLGIFIGLAGALEDRRADLALLRTLGATPATVCLTVIAQALVLGVLGVILGLAAGHAGAEWMGRMAGDMHRVPLTGLTWISSELWVAVAALGLAAAAGLVPAWRAYRGAMPELAGRA